MIEGPHNAIAALPKMSWRGIESPPYEIASFSGANQLAERRFPYLSGAGHDDVGRDPIPMKFRLFFINGLMSAQNMDGAQVNIFPELFEKWAQSFIFDASAGKLIHPLLGELWARPQDFEVDLTAGVRAGVVMNVTFIETVRDPEEAEELEIVSVSLKEVARQADEQMHDLGIDYPTGERTDSLFDMVDQIEGALFSLRLSVEGMINQALGTIEDLVQSVENIQDHSTYILSDSLKQLWAGMKDLLERGNLYSDPRKIAEHVTKEKRAIDSLAEELDNTVGEIMTLNGSLLQKPTVPANTPVRYFIT